MASSHRFAAFANNPAGRSGRNLDVRLQFDLLLGREEVLLLQLPIYPTLGLEERGGDEARRDWGKCGGQTVTVTVSFSERHVQNDRETTAEAVKVHARVTLPSCFYLKLSLWGSSNDNHPLSHIWVLGWGNLRHTRTHAG